jgi:hypothetical protein
MKKLLLALFVVLALAGCESTINQSEKIQVDIISRNKETVTISGDCYLIPIGTDGSMMPICDSDRQETHYNVTVKYKNITQTVNDVGLYNSKKTKTSAYFTKEIGDETGKIYTQYIERIGE